MFTTEVVMPDYSPLPLITKGMPFWKRFHATYIAFRKHIMNKMLPIYHPGLHAWIMIPMDFVIDGASIPRIFWTIIPPMGIFLIPSLAHDFAYRYGYLIIAYCDRTVKYEHCSKKRADDIFYDLTMHINHMPISSWVAWEAVNYGAIPTWKGHRKRNLDVFRDHPVEKVTKEIENLGGSVFRIMKKVKSGAELIIYKP